MEYTAKQNQTTESSLDAIYYQYGTEERKAIALFDSEIFILYAVRLEVSTNTSTATGTATLVFNNTIKTFTITVNHNVISATGGHLHVAAVGVNGPIVFPFTSLTPPITFTSPVLTAAQETDLKEGRYYVNLHSTAFPSGEIRGQFDNPGCAGCWDY